MKKIKGLLFAFVALFAFTLAMVKVNATTIVTNVVCDAAVKTVDGITFTATSLKNLPATKNNVTTPKTAGTSLITGEATEFEVGFKLDSNGKVEFTAKYDWSAKILIGSATAGQSLSTNNGDVSVESAGGVNTTGIISIKNGKAGAVTITRAGSKEMWILEIVLTQTYDETAEFVDVYFHDIDGNAGAANPVVKGNTVSEQAAASILGKQFVKWTLEDGTEFDFNTTINEETHLYPVYNDVELTVADENSLSRGYLKSLLSVWETMPTIAERTEFKGTNYALTKNVGLINNDSKKFEGETEPVVYGINTAGKLGCTEGTWNNAIEFKAPSAGVLKIYGRSGGGTDPRALSLTTDNETFVTTDAVGQDDITLLTLNVAASGTYYLGCKDGAFKIYSIEFEVVKTPAVNLYQERVTVEEVEHIRLVAVVENINDLSDLSLVLKSDALTEDVNLTEEVKVAKRVTDKGETYSIGEVTFDAQDGVVYVKCVISVSSNYAEASFTAELTVAGITKTVDVAAAE